MLKPTRGAPSQKQSTSPRSRPPLRRRCLSCRQVQHLRHRLKLFQHVGLIDGYGAGNLLIVEGGRQRVTDGEALSPGGGFGAELNPIGGWHDDDAEPGIRAQRRIRASRSSAPPKQMPQAPRRPARFAVQAPACPPARRQRRHAIPRPGRSRRTPPHPACDLLVRRREAREPFL